MPLSALLACYHDFSPLLLLCKVIYFPKSPNGLELGDSPLLTELGWTRQIIRDSSLTSSLYGLGQQVVEMHWLAEPILMTRNREAVTWQDKVWMASSSVEIIWHQDFTDAGEHSPVLKAESVGGHSHLVTVLLEQVLSGLRRRKSRLVRKWNMLGENRTPHLKTLTKKLFSFLLAVWISLSAATVCSAIRWAEWRHHCGTFEVKHIQGDRKVNTRSTKDQHSQSL